VSNLYSLSSVVTNEGIRDEEKRGIVSNEHTVGALKLKEFSKKNVIGAVLGQLFFWHKIFDKEAWTGETDWKKNILLVVHLVHTD